MRGHRRWRSGSCAAAAGRGRRAADRAAGRCCTRAGSSRGWPKRPSVGSTGLGPGCGHRRTCRTMRWACIGRGVRRDLFGWVRGLDGVVGGGWQRRRRGTGVAADQRARRRRAARRLPNLRTRDGAQVTAGWRPGGRRGIRPVAGRVAGAPMTQVSHETIYQALFAQGRGAAPRLARCLRTGRAKCVVPGDRPGEHRPDQGHGHDQRTARRGEDRAVPAWEGDLIIGKGLQSRSGRWSSGRLATSCCCTCPKAAAPRMSRPP